MACDTPVFRYALEKWLPEEYKAIVFFNGLSGVEKEAVRLLKENVNVTLSEINVSELHSGFDSALYEYKGEKKTYRKSPAQKEAEKIEREARCEFDRHLQEYEKHGKDQRLPVLLLFSQIEGRYLYQGGVENKEVESIVDSPARADAAKRILSGESAVFFLLLTGDEQKDGRCRNALSDALKKAEKSVVLSIPENNTKLKYATPLKLKFSIIEVDQNDPAEHFFVNCLLQLHEKKHAAGVCLDGACYVPNVGGLSKEVLRDNPLVVPVIGRGRAIDLLDGLALTAESIHELCQYVCGQCSCEIKRQNPGLDMLFAVDWAAGFIPMMGPPDEELALYGLSAYLEPVQKERLPPKEEASSERRGAVEKDENAGRMIPKNVCRTAGVMLLLLVVGTVFVLKKK